MTLQTTFNARYISVITMLAPSTDWFLGVNRASMCNRKMGKWIPHAVWWPNLYDAGTEDIGSTGFSLDGQASDPIEPITRITSESGNMEENPFYNTSFPALGMITVSAEGVDCLPNMYQYHAPTRKMCRNMCAMKELAYKSYRKGQAGECRYVCSCKMFE